MKVSEITPSNIADYLRLSDYDIDKKTNDTLKTYIEIAKKYIKDETGIDDLDKHEDFVIVVYVLCQDMYDNRILYVDKTNINKIVETILGHHRVNLL